MAVGGQQNTAVGKRALHQSIGNNNVGVGYNAGYTVTSGFYNTLLGRNADLATGVLSNSTAIGDSAVATASNQVRIGDGGVTSIGGAVAWSTLSDGRFKQNVRENVPGLDFIMGLRPVTYQLDRQAYRRFLYKSEPNKAIPNDSQLESGFIAQEVASLSQKLNWDFSGIDSPQNPETAYGLRYSQFVVPLVKAVQEQESQIQALEKELAELKAAIQELQRK